MSVALIVLATLLGLIAVGSAAGKLAANPKIIDSMHSVGVTATQVRVLALLEILGALGLLAGIFVPSIGIAAAVGLTFYFLGAVAAHLRVGHTPSEWVPAFVIMLLAIATTILQFLR